MITMMGNIQRDAIGYPTIVSPRVMSVDLLAGRAHHTVMLNIGNHLNGEYGKQGLRNEDDKSPTAPE